MKSKCNNNVLNLFGTKKNPSRNKSIIKEICTHRKEKKRFELQWKGECKENWFIW
jgi:hypothetical protein